MQQVMLKRFILGCLAGFALSSVMFATTISPKKAKQEKQESGSVIVYSESKPNIVVDPSHSSFTLKLESNPTTGYSWFLHEYDDDLIQPVSHQFEQGEKKLMGAPGYEIWKFKVRKEAFVVPQQTTIRFLYARPWEGAENSTQAVFRISTTSK